MAIRSWCFCQACSYISIGGRRVGSSLCLRWRRRQSRNPPRQISAAATPAPTPTPIEIVGLVPRSESWVGAGVIVFVELAAEVLVFMLVEVLEIAELTEVIVVAEEEKEEKEEEEDDEDDSEVLRTVGIGSAFVDTIVNGTVVV